jgi:hypothetical protein
LGLRLRLSLELRLRLSLLRLSELDLVGRVVRVEIRREEGVNGALGPV